MRLLALPHGTSVKNHQCWRSLPTSLQIIGEQWQTLSFYHFRQRITSKPTAPSACILGIQANIGTFPNAGRKLAAGMACAGTVCARLSLPDAAADRLTTKQIYHAHVPVADLAFISTFKRPKCCSFCRPFCCNGFRHGQLLRYHHHCTHLAGLVTNTATTFMTMSVAGTTCI